MKKIIIPKDISKLYKDIYITQAGEILCNNLRSCIYQITPICVIDKNSDYVENIYNAYYSCVKSMPDNIQIISLKDNMDFSEVIDNAKKRITQVQSHELKNAISMYIQKLQDITKDNTKTVLRYYIIIPSNTDDYQLNLMYSKLEQYGLRTKKITNLKEVKNIMRKSIKKENI